MREQYIRVGEGFLLVFSLADRHSLEECYKIHRDILRIKDTDHVPMLLIGNKLDIRQHGIDIQARNAAAAMHIPYFETSARTRYNIDEVFIELVRLIRKMKSQIQMNTTNISSSQQRSSSSCCSCCPCAIL